MMLSDLPVDILVDVLNKLRLETMLICRSVCKLWCNIIDDPMFVYRYLRAPSNDITYLTLCTVESAKNNVEQPRNEFYLFKLDNSSGILDKVWYKENPSKVQFKGHKFTVGCSKGLVCYICDNKLMHIVNPLFSSDILTVPLPLNALKGAHGDTSYLTYSFGFDDSSKSFKVICIEQCGSFCKCRSSNKAPLMLDLGLGLGRGTTSSSSKFTWRELSSPSARYPCFTTECKQSLFVNGTFVFLLRPRPRRHHAMLSFNLEKETWKSVTVPTYTREMWTELPSLFDFDGIIGLNYKSNLIMAYESNLMIWMLISNSENNNFDMWVQKCCFDYTSRFRPHALHVSAYKHNSDVMLNVCKGRFQYCYVYNKRTDLATPTNYPPIEFLQSYHTGNLLHQGSLIRASNLTPPDCSS